MRTVYKWGLVALLALSALLLLSALTMEPAPVLSAPDACTERLTNGGFESGSTGWILGGDTIISNTQKHNGTYSAWLAGYNSADDTLYQTVTLPVSGTATLSFYWYMESEEGTSSAYDFMTVTLRSNTGTLLRTLVTLTNQSTPRATWNQATFNLGSTYAGQTIRVHFQATTDSSLATSFFVDDVSLNVCDSTGGNTKVYLPLCLRRDCTTKTISDPYFSYQYGMVNIRADDAWLLCEQGSPNVTVAIIDTGMSLTHPDLQANLVAGYDFVQNDTTPEDGNGHGSNVGGIVGAPLNGVGVVGVAPQTHLLPVRVLDNSGSGSLSGVANGIRWAADRAQILNLSLGGTSDSSTLRDAVNYAVGKGRLVVVAAGNCGDSYYSYNGCTYMNQPGYPASYDNVFTVAAVNSSDAHASFSNHGTYVDISAPGVQIYSTFRYGGYEYESGTSQASPHVAGLAALIWAKYPSYTAAQVRSRIESTADDLGSSGKDEYYGYGRINAYKALGLDATFVAAEAEATAAPVLLDLQPESEDRTAPFAAGRVLVKFQPTATEAARAQTLGSLTGVSVESVIPELEIQLLRVPAGQEWAIVDALRQLPNVLYAEPDYVITVQ